MVSLSKISLAYWSCIVWLALYRLVRLLKSLKHSFYFKLESPNFRQKIAFGKTSLGKRHSVMLVKISHMESQSKFNIVKFLNILCFEMWLNHLESFGGKRWDSFIFFIKRVPGRGPERREPNKAVLCLLIIIILISYIIIYYY